MGAENNMITYADKVKEKNLLIIKSADASSKITDKKKEVAKAFKDIPIVDTRFSPGGNVINFEN